MNNPIKIAIDGPVGAGKGTLAVALAKKLNAFYVYTGAMYRELALACLREKIDLNNEEEVLKILRNISIELINTDYGVRAFLDGQEVSDEIFKPDVSKTVPIVAAFPKVRKEMVLRQQGMAKDAVRREKNIVMEGRDIATDVLRDADIKIYLTADINTRTQRRLKQLTERGIKTSFDEVLKDIEARDGRDTERTASPLRIAEDAVIIDTTNDTIDQTVDKVMEKLKEKNLI
ncbi:MAG: cytidylate kinase [Candidatus Levybacteria bacterium RIFCSPHIGHO2_02_FULL_37_10]|nr:MAG: cytidylate kinase [Candidatus Levybacteria bacterium RIFCSPHIGHO2_02_FULL_37_10]